MGNRFRVLIVMLAVCHVFCGCRVPGGTETPAPQYNPRLAQIDAVNLLPNGSFELGADHWSSLGKGTGWMGDLSGLYGTVQAGGPADGEHCLRIEMAPGVTPVTYADCWPPARVVQHAPLAANVGWIPVQRGSDYTLSAYMRSDMPGTPATLMFRYAGNPLKDKIVSESKTVTLTDQWQRYTFTVAAATDDLCIALGPDTSDRPEETVNVWIDAVQVTQSSDAGPYVSREPIEIGVETGKYGNIFNDTDPVQLKIHGSNQTANAVTVPVTIQLEDYFGKLLPAQTAMMAIAADGYASIDYPLTIPGKGYYRATITWDADGRDHVRIIKMAVIEPYALKDSCFGVNHAPTTARQLELLSRAGVTWVRNWAHNWQWVEPVQGQVDYEPLDCHIDRLLDSEMNVLSLLPSNPSTNWASTAGPDVEPTLWHRLAYAPKNSQKLYDFITQSVHRYKDREKYWEFLNEPLWIPDFCLPQSKGYTVDDYLTLLKGAYAAMKSADPDCVVLGGLSIQVERKLGDSFINAGGLDYVDIYNLHPYPGFNTPEFFIEHLTRILTVMNANGSRKPMWATECGYYAADDKPWTPWVIPEGWWAARWQLDSERMCADYSCRFSIIYLAHGIKKLFWHQPTEGPVNDGGKNLADCLFAQDAVPRRFYPVQSALANMLGADPVCAGKIVFPSSVFGSDTDRLYGYAFQCGTRAVLAVWASQGVVSTQVLEPAPGLKVFDIMGNAMEHLDGLSTSPIYMVSTTESAAALREHWLQMDAGVEDQQCDAQSEWVAQSGEDSGSHEVRVNSIGMPLVYVPAGEFLMGSSKERLRSSDEGPRHAVTLTRGFWMGQCEVTQKQYQAVMGRNPSHFKGDTHPVDTVSWEDAQAFCRTLSGMEGRVYRLPTEAQWEYACRGGSTYRFCFGDEDAELDQYAWYGDDRCGSTTHAVGGKRANAFGLYDMHGNVWEWCADWYKEFYKDAGSVDPVGPANGAGRVIRGGAWDSLPVVCRSAYRFAIVPDGALNTFGFRVVLDSE